jgi:hypothetical protein
MFGLSLRALIRTAPVSRIALAALLIDRIGVAWWRWLFFGVKQPYPALRQFCRELRPVPCYGEMKSSVMLRMVYCFEMNRFFLF